MNQVQTEYNSELDLSPDILQFLTFILNGEEYGVDILKVQGIQGWSKVTPIPNTPEYLKGVINLRGTIIPIVDLRQRFVLEPREYTATTVVIVLRVESESKSRVMGVVVDAVADVCDVSPENIKPPPDSGGSFDVSFVTGIATIDDNVVILLNIDQLLNADELGDPAT